MADSEPLIATRESLNDSPDSQYEESLLGRDHTELTDEEQIGRHKRSSLLAYVCTRDFWTVLLLGQALAILNTSSSTFTSLLEAQGTSIPAFQTFFNYTLLNIIFTSFTIYKYGFKRWGKIARTDGWKYILFAFCDVEGNYFIVLAYRYTTILSAQLINFWAIVVVVTLSFLALRVRYHQMQLLGIAICIGGMGILLASDHISGSLAEGGKALDAVKGDLFALLAATFYGFSNVVEEYFVSKRPVYEVIGQLAFWATLINGIQAMMFDRSSFESAIWNGPVVGYLFGYTICLASFYTTAPLIYRLASAAFMNTSMLTGNFWGVLIGIFVLKLRIHWLYPVAFVLILLGQFVYYLGQRRGSALGEARKPWLGRNQEQGVSGIFTARRRIDRAQHAVDVSVLRDEVHDDGQADPIIRDCT